MSLFVVVILSAYFMQVFLAVCFLIDGDFYATKSDFLYALNPLLLFIVIWRKFKQLD